MKILLVKPYLELAISKALHQSFLHLEPLELEILAAVVPQEDEVKILDLTVIKNPLKRFIQELKFYSPDIVGLTGFSSNAQAVKKLAQIIKRELGKSLVVVGGIHATIVPHDYDIPEIDLIVRGEGASVFSEIIRKYKENNELFFDSRCLSRKDPDFKEKLYRNPPVYPPIDTIPLAKRYLVDRKKYFCTWTSSPNHWLNTMFPQVASVRTSIGCAFKCSFCVVHHIMNGKYLQRTPKDVVDEIESLKEKYIYFLDDEMFLNVERAKQIALLIKERKIKKYYSSWARSDTIVAHPEIFKLWKDVGLDTVFVGLESFDENQLKEFKKKANVETNKKAVEILKGYNITLHAAFIVMPQWTAENFVNLAQTAKELSPAEFTFTVLSPSPGTPFWQENKDKFICDPYKYYDCMHVLLPIKLPLKKFYWYFSNLYAVVLRYNPLRMKMIFVPPKDFIRAFVEGIKFIFTARAMYKDYTQEKNNEHI